MRIFQALRQPQLAILWLGQLTSAIGDHFYTIAALWLAVRTVGSQAGLVAGADSAAALIVGVLAGALVDRWNRRYVLIAVDAIRGVVTLCLPLLALIGGLNLGTLIVASALLGAASAFFDPALHASLPTLAGDQSTLQAVNGVMDLTRRLARAIGPSLAGLLVGALPLPAFFGVDALTFGLSAASIALLGSRYAWRPQSAPGRGAGRLAGIVADIRESLALTRRSAALSWMMAAMLVVNFVWSVAFILGAPLLVAQALHGTAAEYGLLVGAYGVGNVVSNLLVTSAPLRRPLVSFFTGKTLLGLGFVLMGLAPTFPLAALGAALASFAGPMGDIPMRLITQTTLPPESLGRVFALQTTSSQAGALVGMLIGIPLLATLGPRVGIAVCATLVVINGCIGLARFWRATTDKYVPDAMPAAPKAEDDSAISTRA